MATAQVMMLATFIQFTGKKKKDLKKPAICPGKSAFKFWFKNGMVSKEVGIFFLMLSALTWDASKSTLREPKKFTKLYLS